MSLEDIHEMRHPEIEKVVVHMGVGEGGRRLRNAEDILEEVTGQHSVRTNARQSNPDFGIREGDPIGCKVTLRGEKARNFLEEALEIAGSIQRSSFDKYGDFSFGIEEHTDFEGLEYDPDIGIFGMDVTVSLVRKGKRVERRSRRSHRIPDKQRLDIDDAISFLEDEFGVNIE